MAAATTALIVAIAASSASAQQPPESRPAAWQRDCSTVGKMVPICRAVLSHRETGQFAQLPVAEVWSADNGKTGDLKMTGLNLTEPVLAKVDNGAPERLIKTCTSLACFWTLTETLIANMRTGSELKITMQDVDKKPIEINLPLRGFSSAFGKSLGP